MASLDFEGRRVPLEDGDTVAAALFRAGVRTFNRSLKHHARRGLYCLTGDCPNCLCTVDGEPGTRACTTDARDGMRVRRETGRPSVEADALSVTKLAGRLMPVGFYSKTFIRPRIAWETAEKVIRRATGVGTLPTGRRPRRIEVRNVHTDVLVIGAGIAGLAAALAAAERGEHVVVADEGRVGRLLAPGSARERLEALLAEASGHDRIVLLERHVAVGIYEGPMVPVAGGDELLRVHPGRVVVATGAVETHGVFGGNDLPGVWLGRGAARMAGAHGVRPGARAVVVAHTDEAFEHVATLRRRGVEIAAIVAPAALSDRAPGGARVFRDGRVVAAEGSKGVRAVVISAGGARERVECDTLVLSLGLTPRDALLRMAAEEPVVGAGDVVWPGCSPEEAEESGRAAGRGEPVERRPLSGVAVGRRGTVCLCEDVSIGDLRDAWAEGWRSSEILKRYTTATMGPCQGAMCGRVFASFAAANAGSAPAGTRTTARPPARTVPLEVLAAGVHETGTKRTSLHDRHLEMGAHLDRSGSWIRPYRYGDWREDHRAVRERVSVMDVGTLGKFLVAGRDARTLVDQVFPCDVEHLEPGRSRYLIVLDEAGYAMDDGLLCANPDGTYTITSTSGGSDRMEAGLRDRIDRWGLHVHLLNQTAMLGAINVAGPLARELLERLTDDPVDRDAIPYPGHARITVAGVPCHAIRSGFVGELSFELHHPRSLGVELWDALLAAGRELGIQPHGLDALDVLRLEKGHLFLAQDTLPDDHPTKLGLGWAVDMNKPAFVGKVALERMAAFPLERKLVGFRFDARPQRGAPVYSSARVVGRVTSCAVSPTLGYPIGLGWLRMVDGVFPDRVQAGSVMATVVPRPFYDPEGARIRA
ncbi:MAG TPA: 2Fe-2S iron-sulfur cluster-binding protein [Actinomycetota bacterium]|nr:2Fe-2S iron-sulfur cluster-binding protein [Actinomycetota bacterium]